MSKLGASIKKEFLLLINDRIGLLIMYLMPILLVVIITIVQDSTFKLVNENNIEILIINRDNGIHGDSLVSLLEQSGSFTVERDKNLSQHEIQKKLLGGDHLIAIEIPSNFSNNLDTKAEQGLLSLDGD